MLLRSVIFFILAALTEIGGAWLVWQGVREQRGLSWIVAGLLSLAAYGFVATLQPDAHFGRILAAYGGVFVAGSLLWGVIFDGFRPDRWDIIGAIVCLVGVGVIIFSPNRLTSIAQHGGGETVSDSAVTSTIKFRATEMGDKKDINKENTNKENTNRGNVN